MGSAASLAAIFPVRANVATEIAAGSTLAIPANAAVAATPDAPNHSFMALEASNTAASMAAKIAAARGLNAWPRSSTPPEFLCKAKSKKSDAIENCDGATQGKRDGDSTQNVNIRRCQHQR